MPPLSAEHHLSDRKIGCGHVFDYAVSECPRNEVLNGVSRICTHKKPAGDPQTRMRTGLEDALRTGKCESLVGPTASDSKRGLLFS